MSPTCAAPYPSTATGIGAPVVHLPVGSARTGVVMAKNTSESVATKQALARTLDFSIFSAPPWDFCLSLSRFDLSRWVSLAASELAAVALTAFPPRARLPFQHPLNRPKPNGQPEG